MPRSLPRAGSRRTPTLALVVLALVAQLLPLGGPDQTAAATEWTHVGTGALASSTGTGATVPLPSGTSAGDLLLLGCQGRNNSMNWSATGYTTLLAPVGPSGLRTELLYKLATASEPGSISVGNATGLNGWSCEITALRGGLGSGSPLDAPVASQLGSGATMSAPSVTTVSDGALLTRWYASMDDNNHGAPSAGTLAFGGTAYDTDTGVDHAASMAHLTDATAGPSGTATMSQQSNAADNWVGVTVALKPGGEPPSDSTPPTVISRTPTDGATGVATGSNVTATFSEPMNASTINGSTFTLGSSAGAVSASVTYNPTTRVATLDPASALGFDTLYTATLDGGAGGISDAANNPLAADVTWSFTTASAPPSDTTPPTVTARTPAIDATGVATGSNVTATFSEPMNAATINGSTFTLGSSAGAVSASVTYDAGTMVATLAPTGPLANSTVYTATLDGGAGGISDAANNPLAADVVWSFTTAAAAPTGVAIMPLGDSITHGLPATHFCCGVPGAYRINLYAHLTNVSYGFDFVGSASNGPQADKDHEGHSGYLIAEIDNGRPAGAVDPSPGVDGWLVDDPADVVLLLIGTNDVIQNNNLSQAPTRLSTLIGRITELRPTAEVYVASIPPLVGPQASKNANVITYNTSMRQLVADKAAAGDNVHFVNVYDALTAAHFGTDGIHPTRAGHDRIAAVWFDALVPDPPDVTNRGPAPDATSVATNTSVTATFNEAIDPASVTGANFSLSGGVTGNVTYNKSTNVATFDPTGTLAADTTYTATLVGGAGGIRDLAGNPLTANVTWSFTTADDTSPPPPSGEWTHVGTGVLAASTGTSTSVALPGGVAAGDLLLLGCQGRNNSMNWSATGYTSLLIPAGPAGLRFEVLYKWATAAESGSISVANAVATNGWSCEISALRGGVGSGSPLDVPVSSLTGAGATMMAPGVSTVTPGALLTRWYASMDDNNHGNPSAGTLAFGGTAYDTDTGVDHAASMTYLVDPDAGPGPSATMQQLSNAADGWVGVTLTLRPGGEPPGG